MRNWDKCDDIPYNDNGIVVQALREETDEHLTYAAKSKPSFWLRRSRL